MDVEATEWPIWEEQFNHLAQQATKVAYEPNIAEAAHYLCLYGENGFTPTEELQELSIMAQYPQQVKKVEVDTSYWQDTILFIP